jgi:chromosome partitioning protein
MITICFLSLKGGTGKTTTVLNTCLNLQQMGYKVLLIDLDPAGYLATACGLTVKGRQSVASLAHGASIRDLIQDSPIGMDMIPATPELNFLDVNEWMVDKKHLMRRNLQKLDYDAVLFDCNPSLNVINLQGLAASDFLVIPTEPAHLALKGMRQMYLNLIELTYSYKLDVEIKGIVVTKFDTRKNMHKETEEQLRKMFGKTVFNSVIRSNVAVAKAMQQIKPINELYPNANGAIDYRNLSIEVAERFLEPVEAQV